MSTDSIQPVIPDDLTDVRAIRAKNRAQQEAATSMGDQLRAAHIARAELVARLIAAEPQAIASAATADRLRAAVTLAERGAALIIDSQHSRDQKGAMQYLDETLGPCDADCECLLHLFHAALAKAEGRKV